jgi:hypothetical protein
MASCEYIEWSRDAYRLIRCGNEAERVLIKGKWRTLCAVHKEFAQDALNNYEVQLYKLKEKQRKARISEKIKQLQLELKTGEAKC